MSKQSAGGKATAKILRQQSIDRYLQKPNICLNCLNAIPVDHQTIQMIRRKKFCNQSCGAKFNNARRPKNRNYKKYQNLFCLLKQKEKSSQNVKTIFQQDAQSQNTLVLYY